MEDSGATTSQAQEIPVKSNAHIVNVIVQGVVYIYNKPDKDALHLTDAAGDPTADGGAF